MLYISNYDTNNIRFSNQSGAGGTDRILPKTLRAIKAENDRISIKDIYTGAYVLNHYPASEIYVEGAIYPPELCVAAINNVIGAGAVGFTTTTSTTTTTTTAAVTTTTTT